MKMQYMMRYMQHLKLTILYNDNVDDSKKVQGVC